MISTKDLPGTQHIMQKIKEVHFLRETTETAKTDPTNTTPFIQSVPYGTEPNQSPHYHHTLRRIPRSTKPSQPRHSQTLPHVESFPYPLSHTMRRVGVRSSSPFPSHLMLVLLPSASLLPTSQVNPTVPCYSSSDITRLSPSPQAAASGTPVLLPLPLAPHATAIAATTGSSPPDNHMLQRVRYSAYIE